MLKLVGISMKQQRKKLLLILIQFFIGFFCIIFCNRDAGKSAAI